jgi:uncharacterized membrane protein
MKHKLILALQIVIIFTSLIVGIIFTLRFAYYAIDMISRYENIYNLSISTFCAILFVYVIPKIITKIFEKENIESYEENYLDMFN